MKKSLVLLLAILVAVGLGSCEKGKKMMNNNTQKPEKKKEAQQQERQERKW